VLPVFSLLARTGNVAEDEMYRTFNMGIGMVVIVSPPQAESVRAHLDEQGERHYDIGRITDGPQSVKLI
jgi:phosphoribosylformylglycinamidine cyclo-ligase